MVRLEIASVVASWTRLLRFVHRERENLQRLRMKLVPRVDGVVILVNSFGPCYCDVA